MWTCLHGIVRREPVKYGTSCIFIIWVRVGVEPAPCIWIFVRGARVTVSSSCPSRCQDPADPETLEAETAPVAPPPVSNTAILIERALAICSTLVILGVTRTTLEMVWTWPSKLVTLRTSGPNISRSSLNGSSKVGPERPYISPSSGEEPSGEQNFEEVNCAGVFCTGCSGASPTRGMDMRAKEKS